MILNDFLRDNLISGYQNNSFTAEQVVIFSTKIVSLQDSIDVIFGD